MPVCAVCNIERSKRACSVKDGIGPKGCPTLSLAETLSLAREEYARKDINHLAVQASALCMPPACRAEACNARRVPDNHGKRRLVSQRGG